MKILFVWRKIDGVSGGVERMTAAMMNAMIARGHDISFLSWDREGARNYYPFDKKITWYKLGIGDPAQKGNWRTRFKRMFKMRKIVKADSPDAIICFESGVFFSTRMFLLGFKTPLVAAERNAPSRHNYCGNPKKKYQVFAMLTLADRITVQFERYIDSYPAFLRARMKAIHNPVRPAESFAHPAGTEQKAKILLSVARLSYQKNIDVLIKAFASLKGDFPNWRLKIAGDGEENAKIRLQVQDYELEDTVELLGAVENVKALYTSSHLFCLPSRYEGFPNALAESLSHGLPAVGFKHCCGVSDLIEDHVSGRLAEGNGDVQSLAQALRELMADDQKRKDMGQAAKNSMQAYAPDKIMDEWENFFKTITNVRT